MRLHIDSTLCLSKLIQSITNTLGARTVGINHVSSITHQLHNLPANCAREWFKSSKDTASLLVWIFKKLGNSEICFLWVMS